MDPFYFSVSVHGRTEVNSTADGHAAWPKPPRGSRYLARLSFQRNAGPGKARMPYPGRLSSRQTRGIYAIYPQSSVSSGQSPTAFVDFLSQWFKTNAVRRMDFPLSRQSALVSKFRPNIRCHGEALIMRPTDRRTMTPHLHAPRTACPRVLAGLADSGPPPWRSTRHVFADAQLEIETLGRWPIIIELRNCLAIRRGLFRPAW